MKHLPSLMDTFRQDKVTLLGFTQVEDILKAMRDDTIARNELYRERQAELTADLGDINVGAGTLGAELLDDLMHEYGNDDEVHDRTGRILETAERGELAFRVIRPEIGAPSIFRVDSPDVFRAYVVAIGRNLIYLPRYGDKGLYERLATHPNTNVTLEGIEYPWPSGPVFLHDRATDG